MLIACTAWPSCLRMHQNIDVCVCACVRACGCGSVQACLCVCDVTNKYVIIMADYCIYSLAKMI